MTTVQAPLVFAFPGNDTLASELCDRLGAERGRMELRRFPDGETYVRIDSAPAGRRVILAATLDRPDDKIVPLVFLAATAKELGAERVELVAPYLCYMRQDTRFRTGEGITSRYVAALISHTFDTLVTVDPHLHRHASLSEIYAIPTITVHSAPLLGEWISRHVEQPVVVGPDEESRQWAAEVAATADAPCVMLRKHRLGDTTVVESPPDAHQLRGRTPVLVDDIVASAATMVQGVRVVRAAGGRAPVCLAVHPVFANDAYMHLIEAGAAKIASTNTIPHPSNVVDVIPLIAAAVCDGVSVPLSPEPVA